MRIFHLQHPFWIAIGLLACFSIPVPLEASSVIIRNNQQEQTLSDRLKRHGNSTLVLRVVKETAQRRYEVVIEDVLDVRGFNVPKGTTIQLTWYRGPLKKGEVLVSPLYLRKNNETWNATAMSAGEKLNKDWKRDSKYVLYKFVMSKHIGVAGRNFTESAWTLYQNLPPAEKGLERFELLEHLGHYRQDLVDGSHTALRDAVRTLLLEGVRSGKPDVNNRRLPVITPVRLERVTRLYTVFQDGRPGELALKMLDADPDRIHVIRPLLADSEGESRKQLLTLLFDRFSALIANEKSFDSHVLIQLLDVFGELQHAKAAELIRKNLSLFADKPIAAHIGRNLLRMEGENAWGVVDPLMRKHGSPAFMAVALELVGAKAVPAVLDVIEKNNSHSMAVSSLYRQLFLDLPDALYVELAVKLFNRGVHDAITFTAYRNIQSVELVKCCLYCLTHPVKVQHAHQVSNLQYYARNYLKRNVGRDFNTLEAFQAWYLNRIRSTKWEADEALQTQAGDWIRALGHPVSTKREEAIRQLRQRGESILPLLVEAERSHADIHVRQSARSLIFQLPLSPRILFRSR